MQNDNNDDGNGWLNAPDKFAKNLKNLANSQFLFDRFFLWLLICAILQSAFICIRLNTSYWSATYLKKLDKFAQNDNFTMPEFPELNTYLTVLSASAISGIIQEVVCCSALISGLTRKNTLLFVSYIMIPLCYFVTLLLLTAISLTYKMADQINRFLSYIIKNDFSTFCFQFQMEFSCSKSRQLPNIGKVLENTTCSDNADFANMPYCDDRFIGELLATVWISLLISSQLLVGILIIGVVIAVRAKYAKYRFRERVREEERGRLELEAVSDRPAPNPHDDIEYLDTTFSSSTEDLD